MGWIGIGDHEGGQFDARGLARASLDAPQVATGGIALRGTLLIETHVSPEGRPQTLLAFERAHPWSGHLSLQMLPSGGIVLVDTLGDDLRHAAVMHDLDGRSDQLRVSYSWDAPAKLGRLALEHLSQGRIHSVAVPHPHPMLMDDLRMITRYPTRRDMDADVGFLAVSDRVEPLGPMPGLTAHVPIATPRGDVPAGRLRRGDTVLTSAGEVVPILHTVRQTVPARGSLRPVVLRAPFFGLTRDILLAPHQRLVIGGSQVEYMFGTEAALVPARHLVNGASAYYGEGPDLVTYHHLLLPGHQAILAAGCPVESLYIGRLRRDPAALAGSVLAGLDRARLPEHPRPIWPVLKPFEAVTLAMTRAA
ncbi:Hint domain-containing protein [Rhodobacteraceae bacterium KMM 6894]|nr:Hint domain-containing protein [Rhodobacteraceae bacterium KMM 6894]